MGRYVLTSKFNKKCEYHVDTGNINLSNYRDISLTVHKLVKEDNSYGKSNIICFLHCLSYNPHDDKEILLDNETFWEYDEFIDRFRKRGCDTLSDILTISYEVDSQNDAKKDEMTDEEMSSLETEFKKALSNLNSGSKLYDLFLVGYNFGKQHK